MKINEEELHTRAREGRAAIERLYIEMRHLFNRGWYYHRGPSGEVLTESLLTLSPEIYGSMADPQKVELEGLVYVIDRLPKGIEECHLVKLISEEGYNDSGFEVIVPAKRRRNCYRIDPDQMFIQVTRGRSEIYDILTHLTFLYLEAEKIMYHARDEGGKISPEWKKLASIVGGKSKITRKNRELALTYLSALLGRSFAETQYAYERMEASGKSNNGLFHVVYWLGKVAMEEIESKKKRTIRFSPTLRERIGHHIYGERWATRIKQLLFKYDLLKRPLHIISANLHGVMNSLYAYPALKNTIEAGMDLEELAQMLSKPENTNFRERVRKYALEHGMYEIDDPLGTSISVQIFDTQRLYDLTLSPDLNLDRQYLNQQKPVILVMDYAFGEQAFETLDELLKPYQRGMHRHEVRVESISIMGKAGILEGGKGDIMVPTAHVFEGTADNYPVENDFTCEDFNEADVMVCGGPMITVLGTSLQNRDVLAYFKNSSWGAIGLEMEGAHYQKAIQAGANIRRHISNKVVIRYAYYASDNPLLTGSTLASGSLGEIGVRPTYLISRKILDRILRPPVNAPAPSPIPVPEKP